ncbi:PREDICTED: hematopoietic prostaglandin D synthase-like [Branchiostoma belcheri]|uniref:glutathione transferase n=1 Tax=Branchiostoma belcheri TaxID=7741 RepID=A0A6P5A2F5_BRABE|nr:PREDICTED: hematopoietic prostaglandin D synthase-like [Branchiostoma belcheri]
MPSYKLTYFDARGRAEPVRLLCAAGGIEYEDVRVGGGMEGEQWAELKPKTPMGQLPILEVDGTIICQGKAISRLLAKEVGMAGKTNLDQARADMICDGVDDFGMKLVSIFMDKDEKKKEEMKKEMTEKTLPSFFDLFEKLASAEGYFVGNSLTWADINFFAFVGFISTFMQGDHLQGYVNLNKVMGNVSANPGIAKWLKERPVTQF